MLEFVVFLNCVCIGVLTGAISEISYFIKKIFANNILVNFAIDFAIFLFGGLAVFAVAVNMFDGTFAIFEILGWCFGIALAKNTCKNLFANFVDMVYNNITKLAQKFRTTKFGTKLCK